jgi:hypothetical protein
MLPRVLLARSAVALALSRPRDAYTDAMQAYELFSESSPLDEPSSRLGEALLAMARALQAQGDPAAARDTGAKALAHLNVALGADHPKSRAARQLAGAGTQTSTAGLR